MDSSVGRVSRQELSGWPLVQVQSLRQVLQKAIINRLLYFMYPNCGFPSIIVDNLKSAEFAVQD